MTEFIFDHHAVTNTQEEQQSERAEIREKTASNLPAFGIIAVTKHDRYLWAGLQRPTCSFDFSVFLHAPPTLILDQPQHFPPFVVAHRIRKWEMCCVRVFHRARYRDHHWKHCEHPEWVKHSSGITLHLLCESLRRCPPADCLRVLMFECSSSSVLKFISRFCKLTSLRKRNPKMLNLEKLFIQWFKGFIFSW